MLVQALGHTAIGFFLQVAEDSVPTTLEVASKSTLHQRLSDASW
jgi:hypothetical protein